MVDDGRVFCEATYSLEGDNPLVLLAHMVFERITRWMAELENGKNMEQWQADCKKAAADFLVLKRPLVDFLEHAQMISLTAQENCNTAHYQYNNSQDAYQTFQDVK